MQQQEDYYWGRIPSAFQEIQQHRRHMWAPEAAHTKQGWLGMGKNIAGLGSDKNGDPPAIVHTSFPDLKLLSQGKVRDVYATSSPDALLFVVTDRISAYDVILKNGIPGKGKVLTALSLFWFDKLSDLVPNHFITADVDQMPEEVKKYKDVLQGRSMLVRKAQVIPIEAIVRGYLAEGLKESDKLPQPLFTPSTKAEQGAHDENIHPDRAVEIIGPELVGQITSVALELYTRAAAFAATRGVILADTKFEFGLTKLILIDEVLTPDSSRYWPAASYEPGRSQPSYDKQYLRDWMVSEGFNSGLEDGKDGQGWIISDEVVQGTADRYTEALHRLTS
ncbi:hypothetical protein BS47DRAFT_1372431 [Hydnum rufescens UP504]|uniref:Phosphoribosylaminoimidazole-succinocarboxamide synthase n=1 Tax=Hydnum rufescens UP504 TaxID=1448309 RepID=A0A9P6AY03_9AGAM|nr:hypothetical protein BS47DRAFT_1372431 [Hydnum rufescens UP504]